MAHGSETLEMWLGISPQYLGGRGEPSEASVDLSADVSGAAGGQRASLRLREGPLAYLPGEAILVFVGSVTLVYPQATDNDSEGDPKRKKLLPS